MKNRSIIALVSLVALSLAACDSEEAQVTTTTLDASQLTTTTTVPEDTTTTDDTAADATTQTTVEPSDAIESHEVIARASEEEGETLYILVPPGNYSDVSIENFIGDLLENEAAVSGVELFDDRAALDAAQKPADERTDEENDLIAQHHLVSLSDGRQVEFQGPMSEYDDFVIGS